MKVTIKFILALPQIFLTFAVLNNPCKNNDHVIGHWQRSRTEKNGAKKSFHCCGWDDGDYLHNTSLCGSTGMYLAQGHYKGSNTYYSHSGGHACHCDRDRGRETINRHEEYVWKPAFCDLLEWDGKLFCDLLGNRTIMITGDSTFQQTATTLMSMIFDSKGGCAHQITLSRVDYLVFATNDNLNMFQFLDSDKPDICIMGAGAHMHDEGDMYSVMQRLNDSLWEYKSHGNVKTKFIWKTQNPGHVMCYNATVPTEKYEPGPADQDWFQWLLHPKFDEWGRNWSSIVNYTVLDMSPLYMRPDAHPPGDCLHYCLPGALDLFSVLLLQMLYNREI